MTGQPRRTSRSSAGRHRPLSLSHSRVKAASPGEAHYIGERRTCHNLLHVCAAPVLHDAPDRALEEVQQVVVCPEAHQHDNREPHDLQAAQPSASLSMWCPPISQIPSLPNSRWSVIEPCYTLGTGPAEVHLVKAYGSPGHWERSKQLHTWVASSCRQKPDCTPVVAHTCPGSSGHTSLSAQASAPAHGPEHLFPDVESRVVVLSSAIAPQQHRFETVR